MNYYSMNLRELAELLKKRKLGNVQIRNELGKIYGVAHVPPQQEAARQEAITQLEEYDKNKLGFTKIFKFALVGIGALASIAGIISLVLQILG